MLQQALFKAVPPTFPEISIALLCSTEGSDV